MSHAVFCRVSKATLAAYGVAPIQTAEFIPVLLAKLHNGPVDLSRDSNGIVRVGTRLQSDLATWRVWVGSDGEIWVSKALPAADIRTEDRFPNGLRYLGHVYPLPYLMALCMKAGLDPKQLSSRDVASIGEQPSRIEGP